MCFTLHLRLIYATLHAILYRLKAGMAIYILMKYRMETIHAARGFDLGIDL
jgi:hypothetical protein